MQSLTVITRAIALGELAFVKAQKAILREMANGLFIGLICGMLMGLVGYFWMGNFFFSVFFSFT